MIHLSTKKGGGKTQKCCLTETEIHFWTLLMYSLGVMPVAFLNERKNEALELNPHRSANASSVYLEQSSDVTIVLNSSTLYSFT